MRKSSSDILLAIHTFSPDGSLDQQYIANYIGPSTSGTRSCACRAWAMWTPSGAPLFHPRIWDRPQSAAPAPASTVEDIVGAPEQTHNMSGGRLNRFGRPAYAVRARTRRASAHRQRPLAGSATPRTSSLKYHQIKADCRRATDAGVGHRPGRAGRGRLHHRRLPQPAPAVAIGVLQQPGTNAALETAAGIKATSGEAWARRASRPALDYRIIYNPHRRPMFGPPSRRGRGRPC